MNRAEVTAELIGVTNDLCRAEQTAYEAACRVEDAKVDLAFARAELLTETHADGTTGPPGKNEAAREAHLWWNTANERAVVHAAEEAADRDRMTLRCLQARHSTLRTLARLLSTGGD